MIDLSTGATKHAPSTNKPKDTMTNQFEADYKALHAAALALGTRMLSTLPQAQLDHMAQCTNQGAKLMIEIELPGCNQVALVLRELEGKRLPVCKLGTTQ